MSEITPRQRRLHTDFQSLRELAESSSAFAFEVCQRGELDLPDSYVLHFHGPSLHRECTPFEYSIRIHEGHQVRVQLGPQYPRLMPSLQWITPIFHPNISSSGAVCLGGYSSFWVPSLMLDQLCEMLWDMLVFRNYNLESPYNREAALWMAEQTTFTFPLDPNPLRKSASHNPARFLPKIPSPQSSTDEIRFL